MKLSLNIELDTDNTGDMQKIEEILDLLNKIKILIEEGIEND